MSDDANQYWKAWISAFGDQHEPAKLLCSWHIKRNWESNIKTKVPSEHHKAIRARLDELLNTPVEGTFRVLLTRFLSDLLQHPDLHQFRQYFYSYYCNHPARIQEWALWARRDSVVNTNMFLEAFHEKLKHRFFKGIQNRRMDALINELVESVDKFYLQEYLLVKECGLPANTYRMQRLTQRHNNSKDLDREKVKQLDDEDCWLVPSGTTAGRFYSVKRRNTTECACSLKCRFCKVCPDMYMCTCDDAVMPTTACKHMHLIQVMLHGDVYSNLPNNAMEEDCRSEETTSSSQAELQGDTTIENAQTTSDPASYLRKAYISKKTQENLSRETVADLMLSMADEFRSGTSDLGIKTLVAITSKLKEITALSKSSFSGQRFEPDASEEDGPANKKSKKQRRY